MKLSSTIVGVGDWFDWLKRAELAVKVSGRLRLEARAVRGVDGGQGWSVMEKLWCVARGPGRTGQGLGRTGW